MKDNKVFMAVKIGKESVEGSYKLYTGMGAFNILAVNPNKAELSELQGREIEEEPEYKGKTEEGKNYIRVSFYLKTDPKAKVNNGIDLKVPVSFVITQAHQVGKTSGKWKIIDKFGRTAWATQQEVESKSIPVYTNGPANISSDYRLAYQGEDVLIDFLIQWLNIPGPADYKEGKWIMKKNTEDSEVSLDMDALFKGDVSELKSLVQDAAAFAVKGCVGIRTVDNENGTRQYHALFNRKFVKNAVTDYSRVDAAITEFQNNGGAPNTVFSVEPLHEYVVESTDFTEVNDDPINAGGSPATPWG